MTRTKTIFAVVLAVAIIAGSASAQTSPTEDAGGNTAVLQELVDSQERLIKQQQALIDDQEALLNAYRCMFKVDVEVVPGGCSSSVLSEAEIADGALLCAGWRAEARGTQVIVEAWTVIASGLDRGIFTMDGERLAAFFGEGNVSASDPAAQMGNVVERYHARVVAIIPTLSSERVTGLMEAMADSIQAVNDSYAGGGPAEELAAAIRTALDQLSQLNAALADICA